MFWGYDVTEFKLSLQINWKPHEYLKPSSCDKNCSFKKLIDTDISLVATRVRGVVEDGK